MRRQRLGLEFPEQVALAPEEGESAGELVAAEVALDLHFLVVGSPDPERLALDVDGALVGLVVVPADEAGLLDLDCSFRILDAAHRDVRVVLRESRRKVFRVRVERLHALEVCLET